MGKLLINTGVTLTQLSPPDTFDPDAQAFFNAIGASGGSLTSTEQDAVNDLVLGLKTDSIWSDLHALYPLVGGTDSSTSFNVVNPSLYQVGWVDTQYSDFSNGYQNTHTNIGQKPYGNSNFNISDFTQYQSGIGYYLANFQVPPAPYNPQQDISSMGAAANNTANAPSIAFFRNLNGGTTNTAVWGPTSASSYRAAYDPGTLNGFFSLTTNGTNTANYYYNGSNVGSITQTFTYQGNTNDVFLGTMSWTTSNGPYNSYFGNFGMFYIDKGLTPTQVSNLYSRVTTFVTALGRQV